MHCDPPEVKCRLNSCDSGTARIPSDVCWRSWVRCRIRLFCDVVGRCVSSQSRMLLLAPALPEPVESFLIVSGLPRDDGLITFAIPGGLTRPLLAVPRREDGRRVLGHGLRGLASSDSACSRSSDKGEPGGKGISSEQDSSGSIPHFAKTLMIGTTAVTRMSSRRSTS